MKKTPPTTATLSLARDSWKKTVHLMPTTETMQAKEDMSAGRHHHGLGSLDVSGAGLAWCCRCHTG